MYLLGGTMKNAIEEMNPIEIHTERLIIRTLRPEDAEMVFHYRSDVEENRYQGWFPERVEDVRDFIVNRVSPVMNEAGTWYQFVIRAKEKNRLVGDIGVHFFDASGREVEIGCTLDKAYQRKGYATEAMQKVIGYLFDAGRQRVMASIDPRNDCSVAWSNDWVSGKKPM